MKTDTTLSLADMKAAIKANMGTPQSNQNAATTMEGQRFLAENGKGGFVLATLLANLSSKGKIQAELACSVEGCNETHIREQSDWHQSLKCRVHAEAAKAKLTDDEKAARQLERAKAVVAKLSQAVAVKPILRSGPTLDAMIAAGQA